MTVNNHKQNVLDVTLTDPMMMGSSTSNIKKHEEATSPASTVDTFFDEDDDNVDLSSQDEDKHVSCTTNDDSNGAELQRQRTHSVRIDPDEWELASKTSNTSNHIKSSAGRSLIKRAMKHKLGDSKRKLKVLPEIKRKGKKESSSSDSDDDDDDEEELQQRQQSMKEAILRGLMEASKETQSSFRDKLDSGEISKEELETQIEQQIKLAMEQQQQEDDTTVVSETGSAVISTTKPGGSSRTSGDYENSNDDESVEVVNLSFDQVKQQEEEKLRKALQNVTLPLTKTTTTTSTANKSSKKKKRNLKSMKSISEDKAVIDEHQYEDALPSNLSNNAMSKEQEEARQAEHDEHLKQQIVQDLLSSSIVMEAKMKNGKNITDEQATIALRRITSNIVNTKRQQYLQQQHLSQNS